MTVLLEYINFSPFLCLHCFSDVSKQFWVPVQEKVVISILKEMAQFFSLPIIPKIMLALDACLFIIYKTASSFTDGSKGSTLPLWFIYKLVKVNCLQPLQQCVFHKVKAWLTLLVCHLLFTILPQILCIPCNQ